MENEIQGVSVKQVSVKWGVILGLISIVWSLLTQIMELYRYQAVNWIGVVFSIAVIYLGQKSFKEEGDGFMTFGQGVGIGVLLSLIASVISSVFSWVYFAFIDDGLLQFELDKAHTAWEEQGMSEAQIEQASGFTEIIMSPLVFTIIGFFVAMLFSVVISLIVSAINQRKNPEFA